MNMNDYPQSIRVLACSILIALMLAGCKRTSAAPRIVLPDRYYAAQAALHYFLDKESDTNMEAIVLSEGEFLPELAASFRGHRPPVTTNIDIKASKLGMLIDKATGRPVELWTCGLNELHSDTAIVSVSSSSGNVGWALWYVTLKKNNHVWTVKSTVLMGVS